MRLNILNFPKVFTPPISANQIARPTLEPYNSQELIKIKVSHIWNHFLILLHLRPKRAVTEQIQLQIDTINEAAKLDSKPQLLLALRRAFFHASHAIIAAKMDPTQLPKNVANQLTEIIGRFGIAIYASNDVDDAFQSPLDVLKAAILMQEYALGLRSHCPDVTKLTVIDDLYRNKTTSAHIAAIATECIDNLDAHAWAEKVESLSQEQQLLIPQILRYANGAIRYIKHYQTEAQKGKMLSDRELAQLKAENVTYMLRCGKLLNTAKECLKATMNNSAIDQTEAKNQMAELIYNDLTGYAAAEREEYKTAGQQERADAKSAELDDMWKQCVVLSKFPVKMQARCDNKICFIEKLSVEREYELRMKSLQGHLSLPDEQQDPVLIAISFNNISYLLDKLERPIEALYASIGAVNLVKKCKEKGENNVQFNDILIHADELLKKYEGIKAER